MSSLLAASDKFGREASNATYVHVFIAVFTLAPHSPLYLPHSGAMPMSQNVSTDKLRDTYAVEGLNAPRTQRSSRNCSRLIQVVAEPPMYPAQDHATTAVTEQGKRLSWKKGQVVTAWRRHRNLANFYAE